MEKMVDYYGGGPRSTLASRRCTAALYHDSREEHGSTPIGISAPLTSIGEAWTSVRRFSRPSPPSPAEGKTFLTPVLTLLGFAPRRMRRRRQLPTCTCPARAQPVSETENPAGKRLRGTRAIPPPLPAHHFQATCRSATVWPAREGPACTVGPARQFPLPLLLLANIPVCGPHYYDGRPTGKCNRSCWSGHHVAPDTLTVLSNVHYWLVSETPTIVRSAGSFSGNATVRVTFGRVEVFWDFRAPYRVPAAQVLPAVSRMPGNKDKRANCIARMKFDIHSLYTTTKHLRRWGRREPDSIPGVVAPGFSHVGIVPGDATGLQVFSGTSRFSCPSIPALFYTRLISPASALDTSMLRPSQISLPSYPEILISLEFSACFCMLLRGKVGILLAWLMRLSALFGNMLAKRRLEKWREFGGGRRKKNKLWGRKKRKCVRAKIEGKGIE
ncbi:hypothetical protein PR048_028132 [Dryococelus australis]|uniref:Uncharacterized protein n=1 Tax=Dryococelus australis TaxID=614101 RepID=A0ABQ9GIE0_9NEOP|nr:hypothetical protein PR048_028132 [Dryococelus australis]